MKVKSSLPGHTVYITGGTGHDVATLACNAATGARRWVRLHQGADISLASARSPARHADRVVARLHYDRMPRLTWAWPGECGRRPPWEAFLANENPAHEEPGGVCREYNNAPTR